MPITYLQFLVVTEGAHNLEFDYSSPYSTRSVDLAFHDFVKSLLPFLTVSHLYYGIKVTPPLRLLVNQFLVITFFML